jgi:hypothetical protein
MCIAVIIKWFHKHFCRHNTVVIKRWHPSALVPENEDKVAWIDTLGVANLLQCKKCGKWLTPAYHEHLYGEREKTTKFDV